MNNISKFNPLAINILNKLGIKNPTRGQQVLVEKLFVSTAVLQKISFSNELTPREAACLLLVAKGLTSEEIAELLGIKRTTVETHRRNILTKMSSTSLTQALYKAIQLGLIPPKAN
jgi:DNA-binding NarL/FixJ family response regulator